MTKRLGRQSGFTAVELLITLFVAAAFLIAAYQLFNLVVKDGGSTRAESRAANVAYSYLRQYAASSTTIPCTASNPVSGAAISIDGLASVTINIDITCLPNAVTSLSKVTATIMYNNPQQTLKYATYVSSSGNANASDITNGLEAWWKLNGNANNSIGSPNGVITNATSTTNATGQTNMAYAFNGGNASIITNSSFGLGITNVTISCWIYNATSSNSGVFVKVGDAGSGIIIGIGNTTIDNTNPGTKLVMLFENVRWIPTSTNVGTGWHHIAMVLDASGTPTAYLDGVSAGAYAGQVAAQPSGSASTYIGGYAGSGYSRWYNGAIDDVRLYGRALSQAEILSLYSAGAK